MTPIEFHLSALAEIAEAEDHYARISERLLEQFFREFIAAIERLTAFPKSHPRIFKSYRWVRLRRFPFLIVYRQKKDGTVRVVAFSHERRRPGYWKDRN
jgi:plasmid stabilization system protein ParE